MKVAESRAWLFLTCGDDRQYSGNLGYDDDLSREYLFDNFVPNHRQIAVGDIALLADKKILLGAAVIQDITSSTGMKKRLRCPDCRTTHIKRHRTTGSFRCNNKHYFSEPLESFHECVNYRAIFGDTFVSARGALPTDELRELCDQRKTQHAMRLLRKRELIRFLETCGKIPLRVLEHLATSDELAVLHPPTELDRSKRFFSRRPFNPSGEPPVYASKATSGRTEETRVLQEKANSEHYQLLLDLHHFLSTQGWTAIEEMPGAIDLCARNPGGMSFIFEAKTITSKNKTDQVRGGLAQLLHYRFLYGGESDGLCLVTNARIDEELIRFLAVSGVQVWSKENHGFVLH